MIKKWYIDLIKKNESGWQHAKALPILHNEAVLNLGAKRWSFDYAQDKKLLFSLTLRSFDYAQDAQGMKLSCATTGRLSVEINQGRGVSVWGVIWILKWYGMWKPPCPSTSLRT
jgi:hypothetical protein